MKQARYLLFSAGIILADQITKLVVRLTMTKGECIRVLGDLFCITYVQNTGAGFSFSPGSVLFNRIFFSTVSFIAIVVLTKMVLNAATRPFPAVCYSLIIGGAAGNLIDRVFLGGVTDFFDSDFPDFIMQRWPMFNVADSAIVVGITLLVFFTLFFERKSHSGDTENENTA